LISIIRRPDGFMVCGHAKYAAPGRDIVCAAVSALAQTLIRSLEELTEDKIEHKLERGMTAVKYWTLSEQAKVLVSSFFIGCEMIAEAYPENVQIVQAVN
jgi:uncharacterized protein YsxB (DUF464 family)